MAKTKKKIFFKSPKGPKPLSKQKPKDESTLEKDQDRLERVVAHMGLASRREAKELIKSGQVLVNNKTVRETGFGVNLLKDKVSLRENKNIIKEAVLFYKPRGVETSKTSGQNTDIHDKIPALSHLSPIGRLDKESEGLIILTNDGTLTRALTKIDSKVEKEYLVSVREIVEPNNILKMSEGIIIDKIKTKPAIATKVSKKSFTIVLKEGRKHQIRRMCDTCHLTIESLIRTRIGHLKISSMKPGFVKRINQKDIDILKN